MSDSVKLLNNTYRNIILTICICLLVLPISACFHDEAPILVPRPITTNHFGYVFVGTTANSQAFQWKNIGSSTINTIALIPTPLAGPFTYAPAFVGQSVESNKSTMNFNFNFTPTVEGEVTGSAALGIQEIQFNVTALELKGIGVIQKSGGDITIGGGDIIVGEVLDFGDVMVPGGNPVVKEFVIGNPIGGQPITLQESWFSGNGFSVLSPAFPATIGVGGRITVKIQFAPPTIGDYNDGVWFYDQSYLVPVNYGGTAVKGRGIAGS